MEVVSDAYDFMHGFFKLGQFSAIIPFSAQAFTFRTSIRRTRVIRRCCATSWPGPWATWDPGTNVISDPYIDFGVPGVVVILFAIGLFAKAIRNYVARDP